MKPLAVLLCVVALAAPALAAPREGDPAPGFTLRRADGSRSVSLRDFAGRKPVVLVFGSWT